MSYRARWTWTDTDANGDALTSDRLRGIAVHWPGTTTDAYGVEPAGDVADRIRSWRNHHVNGNGWSDIGYNMAVDQAGHVWELRGMNRVGAHAASTANPDANREWLGVLLILGDDEQPTGAMVEAFRDFRQTRFLPKWPGCTEVVGHQQVSGASTACPGPAALALINAGDLSRAPQENGDEDVTPEDIETIAEKAADAVWARVMNNPITDSEMNARELLQEGLKAKVAAVEARVGLEDVAGEVWGYRNMKHGQQDAWARLRDAERNS